MTAIMALDRGSTMEKKVRNLPAPSILAASSMPSGMEDSKNVLVMNRFQTDMIAGRITAQAELIRRRLLITL